MNKTTWVKRFEKTFGHFDSPMKIVFKEYVEWELQLQRREWIEMIEGMKKPIICGTEGMSLEETKEAISEPHYYNQALDDIIKKVEG